MSDDELLKYKALSNKRHIKDKSRKKIEDYLNVSTMPKIIDGINVPLLERIKIVEDLFEKNSPLDTYLREEFCEILANVNFDKMSKREQNRFNFITNQTWKEIEKASNYLLFCTENEKINRGSIFDERGLKRRYYDGKRRTNQINVGSLKPDDRYDGEEFSEWENVEITACANGYLDLNTDYNLMDLLYNLNDLTEYRIAKAICLGYRKNEIEMLLGLSHSQLKTKIRHIGKNIMSESKIITDTKICSSCLTEKTVDNFGKDSRNKSGFQSICKQCDTERKKKKKLQENWLKTA